MIKVAAIVSAFAACASATLETVQLFHPSGSCAEVALFGAHVVSFFTATDPKRNVFFISSESPMDGVNAITGGVSVVYPNYGNVQNFPYDGLARVSTWTLASNENATDINSPAVATFTLTSNDQTRKLWNCEFALEYMVKLHANTLEMGLNVQNTHTNPVDIEAVLFNHVYAESVLDEGVQINNLKNAKYFDLMTGTDKTETRDSVVFTEETEALYIDTLDVVNITIYAVDPAVPFVDSEVGGKRPDLAAPIVKPVARTVTISKYGAMSGSSPMYTPTDIALWNPWSELSKNLEGFGDEEYKYMVAIGPGRVSSVVTLIPGDWFTLYQNLTVSYPQ